jgi:amino acid transporter
MSGGSNGARTRFGTFGGVFTPCVLMILGVILFLRLGQVVGQAGLLDCLAIILFAHLISLLTALSLASLATNTRVRGGGAYYLISRSLGVEYGGAIGPVFYLALATSVALYVIGFTEAINWLQPDVALPFRPIASVVLLLVFVCVYVGADWTIKLQYLILGVIALALVSFAAGAWPALSIDTLKSNLEPDYAADGSIFTAYALFFPAVTGIMAGANLSGDLEAPGTSIPRGTLTAIGVTGAIYVIVAVVLAAAADRTALHGNAFILGSMAWSPVLVGAGVLAATLSSALSSMMGAPRVLQALARDGVLRPLAPFARSNGRNREPRRAIAVTFVIAEAGVLLGDLDTIAPLITMFFLITYGAINLSCFYELANQIRRGSSTRSECPSIVYDMITRSRGVPLRSST